MTPLDLTELRGKGNQNTENYQVDPSAILLTPYYRTLLPTIGTQCAEEPDVNYTPYHLFCLHSRLLSHLQRKWVRFDDAIISFPSMEDTLESGARVMRILVMLSKNHQFVSLTKNEKDQLQKTIGSIIANFPTHCALYDSHTTLFVGKRPIPRSWVRSMLPYLRLPKEIDPFIEDGMLMVDLKESPNFNDVYQRLVVMMTRQLQQMYYNGTVVCSAAFAERWGLTPLLIQRLPLPDLTESLEEWSTEDNIHAYADDGLITVRNGPIYRPPGTITDTTSALKPIPEEQWTISSFAVFDSRTGGPGQPIDDQGVPARSPNMTGFPVSRQTSTVGASPLRNPVGDFWPGTPLPVDGEPEPIVSGFDFSLADTLTAVTPVQMGSARLASDPPEVLHMQRQDDLDTIGVYQAVWSYPRIIRHRTQFLLDRLHGLRWCRLHLKTIHTPEEEQATWHRIVDELRQIGFPLEGIIFTGCGILLDASRIDNLNQLRRVGAIFHYGWMKSGGPVRTIPVQSLEEATRVQQQVLEQHPELSPARIVIYRTSDRLRPYTVSYKDLAPLGK